MSPTQCKPLKIISSSIRKNSHPSAEIPSTHSHHLGGALPVLLFYQTLSQRPEPQNAHDGSWWRTKFMKTLEEKQQPHGKTQKLSSNMCCSEKAEALFVTAAVSNRALPICKPMYFLPSAIWEEVPWLSAAQGCACPSLLAVLWSKWDFLLNSL